jgi:hypothetical protein
MRIAKRFVLLILLLACWKISQVGVSADTVCSQNCGNKLQQCLADANDAKNLCETQAEWNYNGCDMTATDDYYDCTDNCYAYGSGGYWEPCSQCGPELTGYDWQCIDDNGGATAVCESVEAAAVDRCNTTYNACVNNCPPDPPPSPTP